MRFPSTLSDTRLSFSFFLTTPAKKPRTECCCQLVAFMIAAIVVPFGSRSSPSTGSCFDEPLVDLAETFLGVITLDELVAFDTAVRGVFGEGRAGCDPFVTRFAGFDLDLPVAIWLSLMSSTASCAATDTSPRMAANASGRDWSTPKKADVLLTPHTLLSGEKSSGLCAISLLLRFRP